jgi:hypothetical protein
MIIRFILGSLFLLASTNCKHQRQVLQNTTIGIFQKKADVEPEEKFDPALKPYIASFVAEAKKYGVEIPPETVSMLKQFVYVKKLSAPPDPGVMAICTRFYGWEARKGINKKVKWMTIEIQKESAEHFAQGDELSVREVAYHELFHCLLNKGHLPEGVPGIMSPTLNRDSDRVLLEWDSLMQELFSPTYLKLIPDAS